MRSKHWHVAIGHPDGAAYAVSEYSDSAQAVSDFISLSNSIYDWRISNPSASDRIMSLADNDDFCVAIGMDQPLMIVCTVCECEFLPQNN